MHSSLHIFYVSTTPLGSAMGGGNREETLRLSPSNPAIAALLPRQSLAEKHVFGLKVAVASRERQLICWRGTRAKMVAGVSQINSLLR